ncbi:unnamed protein product [Effrenium voratum]|uniref:PROP1-like PPR domain-containing protein n=1 Tax=Effrenium voratum TaxID=2562239 RepID=A0AA36NGI6_9DINO|nr:unnamed protein product [Effrenium voratum]
MGDGVAALRWALPQNRPSRPCLGHRLCAGGCRAPAPAVGSGGSSSSSSRGKVAAAALAAALVSSLEARGAAGARKGGRRVVLQAEEPEAPETGEELSKASASQQLLQRLREEVDGGYEMVARIFLSASSDLRGEMISILAEETMGLPVENFRWLLRAMRRADVSPESLVQLYHRVEEWFLEQEPNQEQWAQVVYALALSGRLEEAAKIVETMEEGSDRRFPKPDARMYNLLVQEVAKRQGLSAASRLLTRVYAQGLVPEALFFLLLVVAHCAASPSQLDRAKLFLRRGEQLMRSQRFGFRLDLKYDPLYLYTALMAGYFRVGRFSDVFTMLGVMRQRGIRPNFVTFSILQKTCFARPNAAAEVRQLLRVMEQIRVDPETTNYNDLIQCYGQSGQMTLALQVANRMREAGIRWNKVTYLNLIKAVGSAGQVELALRLLTRMRSDGVRPEGAHYTCAFIGLARAGYYEDAQRVFQRLVDLGGVRNQPYNMMMAIHCRRGDMEAAQEVMESMKDAGWPPDVMTYRIMLEGHIEAACDWPAALGLQEAVADLRHGLLRLRQDPQVPEAAKAAAQEQLGLEQAWTKVYHLLVDAAVYNAEWSRAVNLTEELTSYGLPVNYRKHARLLEDVDSSTRALAALRGTQEPQPDWSNASEKQKVMLRVRARWASEIPNVQKGIVPGGVKKEAQLLREEASLAIPTHAFSASFFPGWLDGGDGELEEHAELKLWQRCREQIQQGSQLEAISARMGYQILYANHHATVHRRPMVPLDLDSSRPLVGRVVPESLESLKLLFDTLGWPGRHSGAVYVFLRPATAKLDALLALVSAAAAYPEDVYLMRSEDPSDASSLALECRERNCRAITFSLSAMLKRLPAALLVNRRFLVTNSEDVIKTECVPFDESLRRRLIHQPAPGEMMAPEPEEEEDEEEDDEKPERKGDASSVWVQWLRRNRLHQMIRYDGHQLRLDGVMHRPALSKGESFRARAQRNGELFRGPGVAGAAGRRRPGLLLRLVLRARKGDLQVDWGDRLMRVPCDPRSIPEGTITRCLRDKWDVRHATPKVTLQPCRPPSESRAAVRVERRFPLAQLVACRC